MVTFDTLSGLMDSIRGGNSGSKEPSSNPSKIVAKGELRGRKISYIESQEQHIPSICESYSANCPRFLPLDSLRVIEKINIKTKCRPLSTFEIVKIEK